MATRIQSLICGLGIGKQTAIGTANTGTAGAGLMRLRKLNATVSTAEPIVEDDAGEVGKGHEFSTQTFSSHINVGGSLSKYSTSEFVAWATAFGLGNVVQTGSSPNYTYTITPIDPGTTLELPYFSLVEQIPEGGGNAVDNLYVGCAVESFNHSFSFGPGRASSKMDVNWVGSGNYTSPSAVTVPALTAEKNMLAAGLSMVVNGVDYVSTKRILSGSIGWSNNLNLDAGFFPGSGTKTLGGNVFQTRGRMEIGARVPTFQFTVRLLNGSPEYNTLTAQTTGTAVISVNYDANNSVQYTFQKMAFKTVTNTEANGIVAVTVTGSPEYDNTNGILTVVAKCGITGIAQ